VSEYRYLSGVWTGVWEGADCGIVHHLSLHTLCGVPQPTHLVLGSAITELHKLEHHAIIHFVPVYSIQDQIN
jgi:hypothetical protein